MYPGSMALHLSVTLPPRNMSAASTAMDLVNPINPALEAAYVTVPVTPFSASKEEILIMHLDNSSIPGWSFLLFALGRARIHALSMAREVCIAPSRFVFSVAEMCSGDVRGSMFEFDIPAAFMRMSTFTWDQ